MRSGPLVSALKCSNTYECYFKYAPDFCYKINIHEVQTYGNAILQ